MTDVEKTQPGAGESLPMESETTKQALVRHALLATRRSDLLTPVQAIIDVSDRILGDSRASQDHHFVDDIRRLNGSALELRSLIDRLLSPEQWDAVRTAADWPAVRSRMRHDMLDLVNELRRIHGLTIVMVEQYLEFVKEIGDRFYLMDRRRVVAEGIASDLTAQLVHRHLSV